jgi:hypothetical protein
MGRKTENSDRNIEEGDSLGDMRGMNSEISANGCVM